MKTTRHDSSEGNVWKYVFEFKDAISEAVLYKYESFEKRTVLCVSVQSGCPVGCIFCGTGKKFIRNLTADEIINQVQYILKDMNIEQINSTSEKFQIMFMSMGEPFLNYTNVKESIIDLNILYPNADLLVSTIAPYAWREFADFIILSKKIDKIGLQFSVHESNEYKRNKLIPYTKKMNLREMRDYGIAWVIQTGRPVYINYCINDNNSSKDELRRLKDLFSKEVFNFTFSVTCSADENMKEASYRNLDKIQKIMSFFINDGYDVRMFDPAGQDDIGGGCGQLWHVQNWMKNKENKSETGQFVDLLPY